MAAQKLVLLLLFIIQMMIIHVLLVLHPANANSSGLNFEFYQKTCPDAESITREITYHYISRAPTLAAGLLRMHFHDCFIRGCEGSILLNSTKKNQAEKAAFPNQSLRGFQVIDAVKFELENKCPGVVSCADILALVARNAVSMVKGPFWEVPTGRRDGRSSLASETKALPSPFANITTLKQIFAAKGLSVKDLVVLSAGHSIGVSHCFSFESRLYNFTGKGDTDPSLDPNYVVHLKSKCKPGDKTTLVEMDPGSFKTFDEDYFTLVAKRRGLFQSDAALLTDNETKTYVKFQANTHGSTFAQDFADSMVKMGQIGVLTGNAGEIRKHCAFVN